MKILNPNRILIACSICVVFLFLILNIYTPLVADDYSLSLGIHSMPDIFRSIYKLYYNWSGRGVVIFFGQFWLLVGKPLFNIANTLVYCAFILLVQFHITGNLPPPQKNKLAFPSAKCFLLGFSTRMGASFFVAYWQLRLSLVNGDYFTFSCAV